MALLSSRAWCAPGVVLDGSFGQSGALPGPNFIITAGMGRQVGTNLFQSFSDFNLTRTQSATFTSAGSTGPISNIIARVTGGNASSIDGTINSQITGANLFLLNPSGVMFGPDAVVNVTGSFVVGTSDYVNLSDGGKFNMALGDDSQLTSAPVSAFGFLSATPQPVGFTGTQLAVPGGQGLHVIAGDITLDQGTLLSAPSGNLTLFSAASAGEVPFSLSSPGSGFASATNARFGTIRVKNGSVAAIDGSGGGNLVVRGGKLVVDGSGSGITSFNYGHVAGGNISVQADELTLSNGGLITSAAEPGSSVAAGNVTATVSGDATIEGTDPNGAASEISADTETGAQGGTVNLVVGGALNLSDGGNIVASTDGAGNAGTINVHASSVDIGSNAGMSALSNGGAAGTVHLSVTGAVNMTDNGIISADTYVGQGGEVMVDAAQLNMTGRSLISANTISGSNSAGAVTIHTQTLSIQGPGYLIPAFGSLFGLTGLEAVSLDPGNAGQISVNAASLRLDSGAIISASSFSSGTGGSVTVACAQGQLTNQSEISSTSFTTAGSVRITADTFQMSGNSGIDTSAGNTGGNINLKVGQLLYLLDSNIQAYAGVKSLPGQSVGGNGGNITIDPEFVILDQSLISANDLSAVGHDGNIFDSAAFFFSTDSLLHATGTIDSTAPDLNLANSLASLPSGLIDVNRKLRETCAQSINHEFSTFIVTGRGGVENAPEELQPDFGMSLLPEAARP